MGATLTMAIIEKNKIYIKKATHLPPNKKHVVARHRIRSVSCCEIGHGWWNPHECRVRTDRLLGYDSDCKGQDEVGVEPLQRQ